MQIMFKKFTEMPNFFRSKQKKGRKALTTYATYPSVGQVTKYITAGSSDGQEEFTTHSPRVKVY